MMTKRKADKMNLRLPLVVILGATGSGKTKLSLDLAKRFGGEIIGADSMQVYKALDIITAKATKEEMKIAPHHMIDILEPHETFTVLDYRNRVVPIIDKLISQNKMPIVVGGTNYYIESLLWKILIENTETGRQFEPGVGANNEHTLPSTELHKQLQELDPCMAERIHPNNKRKILRSIEVLQQKGRLHSELLKEQQASFGGSSQGGGLRYKDSLVFWLTCEQSILDVRLDNRVDCMIEQGLVDELKQFHVAYNMARLDKNKEPDYTKGIFQSIGFKEFHNYLKAPSPNEEVNKKTLEEGIEELKRVTRRFARKQTKWVRNRFLGRKDREVPPIFGLKTDDVLKWDENVTNPAIEIIDSFMLGKPGLHEKLPPIEIQSCPNSQDKTFTCEICERVFIGEFQWNIHIKSSKHKKRVHSKNKQILEGPSEKILKTS